MAQPDPQHLGLQRIEPRDRAPFGDVAAVDQAVIAQPLDALGERGVGGGDKTGVAGGVEVLQRVAGEAADRSERAAHAAV